MSLRVVVWPGMQSTVPGRSLCCGHCGQLKQWLQHLHDQIPETHEYVAHTAKRLCRRDQSQVLETGDYAGLFGAPAVVTKILIRGRQGSRRRGCEDRSRCQRERDGKMLHCCLCRWRKLAAKEWGRPLESQKAEKQSPPESPGRMQSRRHLHFRALTSGTAG